MLTLKVLNHLHPRICPSRSSIHYSFISSFTTRKPQIAMIEHIVLFKVREFTDPSKTDSMIANLRSLISLDIATYLSTGPISRSLSMAADQFGFTHILHSRYRSMADLDTYAAHPSHQAVVRENVLPICDDIMAVDWVTDNESAPLPGSLTRITIAKRPEGASGAEIVKAIEKVSDSLIDSVQVSYGENFSPVRSKGYEIGIIMMFSGADEVSEEGVEKMKEKLIPLLENAIVVDYLVPFSASSL